MPIRLYSAVNLESETAQPSLFPGTAGRQDHTVFDFQPAKPDDGDCIFFKAHTSKLTAEILIEAQAYGAMDRRQDRCLTAKAPRVAAASRRPPLEGGGGASSENVYAEWIDVMACGDTDLGRQRRSRICECRSYGFRNAARLVPNARIPSSKEWTVRPA